MRHARQEAILGQVGILQLDVLLLQGALEALPQRLNSALRMITDSALAIHAREPTKFSGEPPRFDVAGFQRLVRRHAGSGRKVLYLSAHASHIVGWPVPEGRLLLHDLTEHATQRQFVYSHQWRVGDLVIWDNRDTMHRGRPHDESQPRDLRRATTLDVGSTLDEAA